MTSKKLFKAGINNLKKLLINHMENYSKWMIWLQKIQKNSIK